MPVQPQSTGTLFVVATPIGNLSDLSPRACEVFAQVALVAAEDTRHTGALLRHFGIDKPLISLHEHNESTRLAEVIARLQAGDSVALASDAGTPLISDPGFSLVRAAIEHGVRVVPLPGPCAAIAALSIAGLPTDRFVFEGFLPIKSTQRRERLTNLSAESRTLIFYEAPHRLEDTLSDMAIVLGARQLVVARELTKQFESVYRGTAVELAQRVQEDQDMKRGELVILVAGEVGLQQTTFDADNVLRVLLADLAPAQAAKMAARITGATRDDLYQRAIFLSAQKG